jgi:hypothetical protein
MYTHMLQYIVVCVISNFPLPIKWSEILGRPYEHWHGTITGHWAYIMVEGWCVCVCVCVCVHVRMHVCAHIFPKSLKLTHYQYLALHCNMLIQHLYYSCEYKQIDMHSMTQVKNHVKNCILVWDFVLMWGFCHYFLFMIDQFSQSWKFENRCVIQCTKHRTLRLTCQLRCSPYLVGPVGQLGLWMSQEKTIPCYQQFLQKEDRLCFGL